MIQVCDANPMPVGGGEIAFPACPNPQLCIEYAIDVLTRVIPAVTFAERHHNMTLAFDLLQQASSMLF